jgi:hypothetical protein
MPMAAIAGIGAIGSIGSALIGSNSAKDAAAAQMAAANKAAGIQQQGSTNALNYQNGIYNQTQQNLNPYINAGGGALNNLSYLLGVNPSNSASMVQGAQPLNLNAPQGSAAQGTPGMGSVNSGMQQNPGAPQANPALGVGGASGLNLTGSPSLPAGSMGTSGVAQSVPRAGAVSGIQGGGINQGAGVNAGVSQGAPGGGFGSLTQGYGQTFQAPTGLTEQNDPGYQARMQLGTDAIQRSAAARGGVLTGGTAKALDQFGQDYGSNEYGNVYNRALNTFGTNYGVWNNDNNNIFSRLMGLTGVGQNASNSLGQFGQATANNVTQNLLGTGQQVGQDYQNAGAANASGIYNQGAALSGGINGVTGNLSQLLMLKQLGLAGGGSGGVSGNSSIPGVGF